MGKVQAEAPRSILDVGAGFGKYGVLCRELLELPHARYHKAQWQIRLDGVEVFPGYQNPIHDYVYDRVYYGDIRTLCPGLQQYDVVLLIDVLEHFPKDEGLELLHRLVQHTGRAMIISTPVCPAPQGSYLGNQHEAHLSRWSIVDFAEFDFTYQTLMFGGEGAHVLQLYPGTSRPPRPAVDGIWQTEPPVVPGPLVIGCVLPHRGLTGGLKSLLEQVRHLRRRGHRVRAIRRGGSDEPVFPAWSDVRADEEVMVPPGRPLAGYVEGCDVVLAGWYEQLLELEASRVPALYWEQGHGGLLGDIHPVEVDRVRSYLVHHYSLPVPLAAVSPFVATLLHSRYNRHARVVPAGVDTTRFCPGAGPSHEPTVLLVANPSLAFKGCEVALKALQRVWDAGHRFRVTWVCHTRPQVVGARYPLEFVVNPPQGELPGWYQNSHLLLFTSWYEGFGLPPLEAMAAGVPVVTTRCGGVLAYVEPGVNALLAEPGDVVGLSRAVAHLLENPGTREALAARGRQAALRFAWESVVQQMENALVTVATATGTEKGA